MLPTELLIFNRRVGDQLIEVFQDDLDSTRRVDVTYDGQVVGSGDQIRLLHAVFPGSVDTRQVAIVNTDAIVRMRPLDADQAADHADRFGTSFEVLPTFITGTNADGRFYLKVEVSSLAIISPAQPDDPFRIQLVGAPAREVGGVIEVLAGVTASCEIVVPVTTPEVVPASEDITRATIAVSMTVTSPIALRPENYANHEAVRAFDVSGSYVPANFTPYGQATHDADLLEVRGPEIVTPAAIDLTTATLGQLLLGSGRSGANELRVIQREPGPLNGDTPDATLSLTDVGNATFHANAFLGDSGLDVNDDNLSAFLSLDTATATLPVGTYSWTLNASAFEGHDVAPSTAYCSRLSCQYAVEGATS